MPLLSIHKVKTFLSILKVKTDTMPHDEVTELMYDHWHWYGILSNRESDGPHKEQGILATIAKHVRRRWLCSAHWMSLFDASDAVLEALIAARCPMRPLPSSESDEWYDMHYRSVTRIWRKKNALRRAWNNLYFRAFRKTMKAAFDADGMAVMQGRGAKRAREDYETDIMSIM